MTDLLPLTPRQREILNYIRSCIEYGEPPTFRKIGEYFGITVNGVSWHIRSLERKGHLFRDKCGDKYADPKRTRAGGIRLRCLQTSIPFLPNPYKE